MLAAALCVSQVHLITCTRQLEEGVCFRIWLLHCGDGPDRPCPMVGHTLGPYFFEAHAPEDQTGVCALHPSLCVQVAG